MTITSSSIFVFVNGETCDHSALECFNAGTVEEWVVLTSSISTTPHFHLHLNFKKLSEVERNQFSVSLSREPIKGRRRNTLDSALSTAHFERSSSPRIASKRLECPPRVPSSRLTSASFVSESRFRKLSRELPSSQLFRG